MNRKIWLPVFGFLLVFILHLWITVASFPPMTSFQTGFATYFTQGLFWLGYSYALTAAFTVYALLLSLGKSKRGAAGMLGGVSWAGALYAMGCWAVGCCGSPLLAVYLGAFGSRLLGLTQPIVAAITTISVLGAFLWIRRESCRLGI